MISRAFGATISLPEITCRAALNAPQSAQSTATTTTALANLNESLFLCFSLRFALAKNSWSLLVALPLGFFIVVVVVAFARDKNEAKDKTNRGKARRE